MGNFPCPDCGSPCYEPDGFRCLTCTVKDKCRKKKWADVETVGADYFQPFQGAKKEADRDG